MDAPGWLSQELADVPAGDQWLGDRERRVLDGLRFEQRRCAWRLGRWTAKLALSRWLTIPVERIEVLAAADGAPEAWVDGEQAPVSISISHRDGRGLAVVAGPPLVAGCDLELIEPRSGAFVREWLAASEQELIASCEEPERALRVNLIWTAKEVATKVRREGLRLDIRQAVVTLAGTDTVPGAWNPLVVDWGNRAGATAGWWRVEPGWVMAIAAEPPPDAPWSLQR